MGILIEISKIEPFFVVVLDSTPVSNLSWCAISRSGFSFPTTSIFLSYIAFFRNPSEFNFETTKIAKIRVLGNSSVILETCRPILIQ